MKIFSAEQIKLWDKYTIANERILSIEPMEIAATACFEWILKKFTKEKKIKIFGGKGNNGGDGLAIARPVVQKKYAARI